jgi:hypothetical protein
MSSTTDHTNQKTDLTLCTAERVHRPGPFVILESTDSKCVIAEIDVPASANVLPQFAPTAAQIYPTSARNLFRDHRRLIRLMMQVSMDTGHQTSPDK